MLVCLQKLDTSPETDDQSDDEDKENEPEDEEVDDDDGGGWITPSNINQVKLDSADWTSPADVSVGCLTTDFAMQVTDSSNLLQTFTRYGSEQPARSKIKGVPNVLNIFSSEVVLSKQQFQRLRIRQKQNHLRFMLLIRNNGYY